MRLKGVVNGLIQPGVRFSGTNSFTHLTRTFTTFLQNPPYLNITQPFDDDAGNHCKAYPNSTDSTHMAENNKAFKSALISVRYTDITIPAGRYYFSEPINNLDANNKPILFPRKTIRGDATTTSLTFPNVGYPLTLDCPSTILDYSRATTRSDTPLIKIDGSREPLQDMRSTLVQGRTQFNIDQSHSIQDGDLLLIQDRNIYSYSVRDGYRKGEFLKVKKITRNQAISTIELENPAFDSYDHTAHGTQNKKSGFTKVIPIQIHLENITIMDNRIKDAYHCRDSYGNETRCMNYAASSGLMITQCIDSEINNIYIIDASYNCGLSLRNSLRTSVNSGKFIIAKPHQTRLMKKSSDYSVFHPIDAYGVMISDSQDVTVDGLEAKSWGHAIATGSGGGSGTEDQPNDPVFIVNRNIHIKNSDFTNTPVDLYFNNENTARAVDKRAPANFHGNIESSSYVNNTLHGGGFNIGGHNVTLDHNTIYSDNYKEPLDVYYRHWNSAFYFDETKSGQHTIKNNRVFISKFYQNAVMERYQRDNGYELRYGEFVHFNFGGVLGRKGGSILGTTDCTKAYSYWFAGTIYPNGTLDISNNCVRVTSENVDQDSSYTAGLITISGVSIDKCTHQFLNGSQDQLPDSWMTSQQAQVALRTKLQIDVKISGNTFSIFNNPRNSTALVAINPKLTNSAPPNYWSRVRSVEMVSNKFCGRFRFSFNKSYIFDQAQSDRIKVRDNTFWSDLPDVEAHINQNIDKTSQKDVGNNLTNSYTGSCPEVGSCSLKT